MVCPIFLPNMFAPNVNPMDCPVFGGGFLLNALGRIPGSGERKVGRVRSGQTGTRAVVPVWALHPAFSDDYKIPGISGTVRCRASARTAPDSQCAPPTGAWAQPPAPGGRPGPSPTTSFAPDIASPHGRLFGKKSDHAVTPDGSTIHRTGFHPKVRNQIKATHRGIVSMFPIPAASRLRVVCGYVSDDAYALAAVLPGPRAASSKSDPHHIADSDKEVQITFG